MMGCIGFTEPIFIMDNNYCSSSWKRCRCGDYNACGRCVKRIILINILSCTNLHIMTQWKRNPKPTGLGGRKPLRRLDVFPKHIWKYFNFIARWHLTNQPNNKTLIVPWTNFFHETAQFGAEFFEKSTELSTSLYISIKKFFKNYVLRDFIGAQFGTEKVELCA